MKRQKSEDKFINCNKYRRIRDHCHWKGKYKGAAHSMRNFKWTVPEEIPVVFYSGSTFDY